MTQNKAPSRMPAFILGVFMKDNENKGMTLDVQLPFNFGISPQGDLNIGFYLSGIPTYIVVPSNEVKTLRNCLNQCKTIQETLSVKIPPQGAH